MSKFSPCENVFTDILSPNSTLYNFRSHFLGSFSQFPLEWKHKQRIEQSTMRKKLWRELTTRKNSQHSTYVNIQRFNAMGKFQMCKKW